MPQHQRRLAFVLAAALAAGPAGIARGAGEGARGPVTLASLVSAADEKSLVGEKRWRRMLHLPLYADGPSAAETPRYFLLPDGRTDPHAELNATLAAFLAPARGRLRGDRHAICRFPARFRFVTDHLGLSPAAFPRPRCVAFDKWLSGLADDEVTFLFAGYAQDDPTGVLGHVFLKTNAKGETSRPLDYTLNYAIKFPRDATGIRKTVGSIRGEYEAFTSTRPYYTYADSYSNRFLRDVWQYTLALTPEERYYLLAHAWEIQGRVKFTYELLGRNCVTLFLTLLEVAKPELGFDESDVALIYPSDVVRNLFLHPGLVKRVDYAPSGERVFAAQYAALNAAQAEALAYFLETEDGAKIEALPEGERAAAWVVAATRLLIDVRRETDKGKRARLRRLRLTALTRAPKDPPAPLPARRGPEHGHDNSRLTLAGGRYDGTLFTQIENRLLMHGRLDHRDGFNDGNFFEGFDLKVRIAEEKRMLFHELVVLNAESYPTAAVWGAASAHRFKLGLLGDYPTPLKEGYALYLNQGWGLAWFDPVDPWITVHATLGHFTHVGSKPARPANLEPELDAGVWIHPARIVAAELGATARADIVYDRRMSTRVTSRVRFLPTPNINFEASVARELRVATNEWRISVLAFY